MSTLLYRCMAKATTAEGDQLKYGVNWAISRRGILKVFDDHIECGPWKIDYSEIENAVLSSFRSLFFYPGYVLRIDTANRTYHFGLNGWSYWKGEFPFPVTREKARLGHTPFSIIMRVLAVAWIAWWVWRTVSR